MERRYVPLRPWSPGAAAEQTPASEQQPLESKRRRVGVAVACNDCRRRKIRCDGKRPKCSNCRGKSYACEYRDDGDISKESRELITEVVRSLNSLPDGDKLRILKELSKESNAWTIVTTLRHTSSSNVQHPSYSASTGTTTEDGISDVVPELETMNPIAYPDNEDIESNMLHRNQHPQLTGNVSDRRPMSECTEMDSVNKRNSNAGSENSTTWPFSSENDRRDVTAFCDSRLAKLSIRHWTSVDISDELAAKCISLYLKTDHPLLGHFDPELFVSDLVAEEHDYCSPLLVNSMLYWACQMYSAIDPKTDALATEFCAEAETLWAKERQRASDSTLTLASAAFLGMGYLGQGRDHAVLKYLKEAANMAGRMGLFGSEGQSGRRKTENFSNLTGAAKVSYMYAAWGIFNWLTLMSLFYHQPGMICPASPPLIAVPKGYLLDTSQTSLALQAEAVPWLPEYMGDTFPYLCWFWTIVREISWVYHVGDETSLSSRGSLPFAEFKFRELLAWTNSLPPQLFASQVTQHHVQVMHIWFHAGVLDLFRPFVHGDNAQGDERLRTFAGNSYTPSGICAISTSQLKRLVVNFRLNYSYSNFTILWHTALIYVANAILEPDGKNEDWYTYLLLCLYGYERLSQSWRVAKAISKGLLSMTLRKGGISSEKARTILRDLENNNPEQMSGDIRATFMLDLDRAFSEPDTATVEYLANQLEDNVVMQEYTNIFDQPPN